MDNALRIKKLITILNNARDQYYNNSNSPMSDYEYDNLYDELEQLEHETNIIYGNSPTQTVGYEVKSKLEKIAHSHPMLSLDKTKSVDDLVKFSNGRDCIISLKMDGLTTLCTYNGGELIQAETRGNGEIGELITHNAKVFDNLPLKVLNTHKFEIEGEAIITKDDFEKINSKLVEDDKYKNPRNLASGSARQLDSKIAKERHVRFIVWKVPYGFTRFTDGFKYAKEQGFEIVPYITYNSNKDNINEIIDELKAVAEEKSYPIDGLVITYNDVEYGKSLGMTGKFPRHSLAFKFYDEEVATTLKDIEWGMGKTGILTPVAIFESVELEGTTVERASLHNISVMLNVLGSPYKGQEIGVCKKNQIIPQITWGEKTDICNANIQFIYIPDTCPICGGKTQIIKENDSKQLFCTNPDCKGKLLGKLTHAVSRNALNIDGLSESTIEKFISLGWLTSIKDIYHLHSHEKVMKTLDGFGKKSVDKLLDSINVSRNTTLARFLYSLSIPLLGKTASAAIAETVDGDYGTFIHVMTIEGANYFRHLPGVGDSLIDSMNTYFKKHIDDVMDLSTEFIFELPVSPLKEAMNAVDSKKLEGKTFVITGSLNHYANRDAAKMEILAYGGKVSDSVSAKTSYLVNNDINSGSSKNKKAKSLGIPIITEEELIAMIH